MDDIVKRISLARKMVGCSSSRAWFRGQTNEIWPLKPSIFRGDLPDQKYDRWTGRVRGEVENEIGQLTRQVDRLKSELNIVNEKLRASRPSPPRPAGPSVSASTTLLVSGNVDDLRIAKKRRNEELEGLQQRVRRSFETLRLIQSLAYGERDAYGEFCLRRGYVNKNSWVVLAEMQHYGVRTRLLDWSESLNIAFFFSVERYLDLLKSIRKIKRFGKMTSFEVCEDFFCGSRADAYEAKIYDEFLRLPEPCIWVLNPFRLAEKSGEFTTRDFPCLLHSEAGYVESFLDRFSWRHERPIPVRIPWSEDRIRNQKGYFTVWGSSVEALDVLNAHEKGSNKFLEKVRLTREEALTLGCFLSEMFAPDLFDIYLSVDHLGRKINNDVLKVI